VNEIVAKEISPRFLLEKEMSSRDELAKNYQHDNMLIINEVRLNKLQA